MDENSSGSDNDLVEMISRHEGLRNFAYDDSLGVRTIGVGFNLERSDAKEKISELGLNFSEVYSGKSEISNSQAYFLMNEDIKNSTLDAKKYIGKDFDNLPLDAKHVLIDMSYNLGYSRLSKFKNFRKEILEGDFDGAAEEMIDSKWYGQVGNRSKELVEIMRDID
jgi:GH24 family phage-related lysozyme (muramidase)